MDARFAPHRFVFILAFAAALLFNPAVEAQVLPEPPPESFPQDLPMDTLLWEAEQLGQAFALGAPGEDRAINVLLIGHLEELGLEVRPDLLVHLEVVGPNDGVVPDDADVDAAGIQAEIDAVRAAVGDVGGEAPYDWMRSVDAWAPLTELSALATSLPDGWWLRRSEPPVLEDAGPMPVMGEGPAVTNSNIYRDAGANGAGITIAVTDQPFDNFTAAQRNGDAPARPTIVNYRGGAFGGAGMRRHGTGCVEAAYDHAPGADYRIYAVDNLVHLGRAIEDLIRVPAPKLISHSMSWPNTGWADNSGRACAAALRAARNGILFFTAAGNQAQRHYQAVFAPQPGNPVRTWHQFAARDSANDIVGIPDGQSVRFDLQWDNSDRVTDYNLYLYDSMLNVIARSTNMGAARFESVAWTNRTGAAATVHLAVRRVAGNAVEFELFGNHASGIGWQYVTPESSTGSPANTNHLNVIAVGAVHHGDFNSRNGTMGIIAPYSGRGPTNGGLRAPDICGPTNTVGFSYPAPRGFGGTSGATPNAAGATAVVWSADPSVANTVIRTALYEWPLRFRDWGDRGRENVYGRGGVILPEVRLDIMPGQDPNPIFLRRNYTIYVVVMASDTFAVNELNNRTARFGPTLATAVARAVVAPPFEHDFDGDGRIDKMFGFRTFECGFGPRDRWGVFKSRFTNGAPFAVRDGVAIFR